MLHSVRRNERRGTSLKRFLKVTALFLLPIALLYLLFGIVLLNSRELAPLDDVVAAAMDGSLQRYGSAYHENIQAFKYRTAVQKQAKLLVLGTSRSMQLRAAFFSEPSFFNAGGGARDIYDYERFLRAMPEQARPDTVVLVLDQNMFNETWCAENATQELQLMDIPVKKDALLRVGASYGNRKFSLLDNLRSKPGVYGLAAAGRGSGFSADGSYHYGEVAEKSLDEPEALFADTMRDIDFSRARFAWGEAPSERALEATRSLLAFCEEAGIDVVGILPPFAPSVAQKMADSGHYGYLAQLPDALEELFAEYGKKCYNYGSVEGTTAVQYLDGYHGGDEVYATLLLDLAARPSAISGQINTAEIHNLLETPHPNPRVLP